MINHYDPFDRSGGGTLDDATDDLVRQIQRGSPHLRARGRIRAARGRSTARRGLAAGAAAVAAPITGGQERVTVLTRELTDDHVLYALLVAPETTTRS